MRPGRITSETVERNIRQQREIEHQRHQLAAFGKENANLLSVASSQAKIEQQRRMTQQQISRNEQMFEEQMKKSMYDRKMKDLTASQNQALAAELDKESADMERRRREVQKICEDAPELRDLERMLKIAYLNKERAAQYEEKISLAMREQERIQAIEDEMEANRIRMMQKESNADIERKKKFAEQRAVLQAQINERQERLKEAQLQMERDRTTVDEIMSKIQREDEEEMRSRREKQAATAKMVKDFEIQRQRELEERRAAERAEEERIAAFQRAMDARTEGIAAKKQAKKEEDDRILRQIVEETERKRKEEEEFNALRDLLWEEELEAKRNAEVAERRNKQIRMRDEMMEANSRMMQFKQVQRLKEAENEARLIALMRQKFAEDEAKERAEEEERRRQKMHHMSLIERQKDERKHLYEREREEEARLLREAQEREDYRKKVIQEARKRLLEEHASRLKGFLPNKVFESREEYEQYRDVITPY